MKDFKMVIKLNPTAKKSDKLIITRLRGGAAGCAWSVVYKYGAIPFNLAEFIDGVQVSDYWLSLKEARKIIANGIEAYSKIRKY
jgi:hypothetical protein